MNELIRRNRTGLRLETYCQWKIVFQFDSHIKNNWWYDIMDEWILVCFLFWFSGNEDIDLDIIFIDFWYVLLHYVEMAPLYLVVLIWLVRKEVDKKKNRKKFNTPFMLSFWVLVLSTSFIIYFLIIFFSPLRNTRRFYEKRDFVTLFLSLLLSFSARGKQH